MKIALKKEAGEVIEKEFNSKQVIIGRSNKSDFMVLDEALSRQHCLIELDNGEFYITDLGSSNGVFIDGNRIPAHTRTLYNSFNDLSVGVLECTLQDSLVPGDVPHYREPKAATEDSSNQTVVLKSPHALKINEGSTKENQVSKFQLMILPIVILGAVIYYYATAEHTPEESVITIKQTPEAAPDYKNNIQLLKEMPNEFKSNLVYQNEEKLKTCAAEFEKVCQQMKLNTEKEGLYPDGKNLTIYLMPSLYENQLRYRAINSLPDKYELIALDKVLGSSPMNDYFLGQNLHLHICLLNLENMVEKVIRFHPMIYSQNTANRMDALRLLEQAIQSGEVQNFWAYFKKYRSISNSPTP